MENEKRSPLTDAIPATQPIPPPWTPHHEYCKIPGLKVKDAFESNVCGVECELNGFGSEETFTDPENPQGINYGKFSISSNNECLREDCNRFGFTYTMNGTLVNNITPLPNNTPTHLANFMCPAEPGYWPELIEPFPIVCTQDVDPTQGVNAITNKCRCAETRGGVTEIICKQETLHRRALYHAQRLLYSLRSADIGISTPNKIDLEIVDFYAIKDDPAKAIGLCGETRAQPGFTTRVQISSSTECGNHEERMGSFQGTVYHEITHAVEEHLGISGPYVGNFPTNEYSAANEGRAIYVGGSFTRFSDNPGILLGVGKTSSGTPRRGLYPNNFNELSRCPNFGQCTPTQPDRCGCSPHTYSDVWVNTFIALEKLIGQRDTLRLVFHHPLLTNDDANFVHPRDLLPNCSMTPPKDTTGFTGAKSYYEAMIEADDYLYFGKHRLEIWKAFRENLSNPECLKKYDDIGNSMSAASYIDIRNENRTNSYNSTGTASINHEFDEDWFYVYSPSEKTLKINIDPYSGIKLRLRVYNKTGTLLLETTSFSSPVEFSSNQNGMYYIQISRNTSVGGPTQGDYSIYITSSMMDRESNSMDEGSEPIPLSKTNSPGVLTTGSLDYNQDVDTFRFWLNSDQNHNINFELSTSSPAPNFQVKLEVYNESLALQTDLIHTGNGTVSQQHTLSGGQWYFIKVFSPNQTLGDYGIKTITDPFSVDMKDARGAFILPGTVASKAIHDPQFFGPSFLLEPNGLRSRIAATIVNELPKFYKFFLTKNQKIKLNINSILSPSMAINLKLYERTSTTLNNNGVEFQSLYSLSSLRKSNFDKTTQSSSVQVHRTEGYIKIQENISSTTMYFTSLKTGWYLAEIAPIDQTSFGSYKISLTMNSPVSRFPLVGDFDEFKSSIKEVKR